MSKVLLLLEVLNLQHINEDTPLLHAVGGGKNVNVSEKAATDTETTLEIGHTVNLLTSSYKSVGTALLMTGNVLHGHNIPKEYKKVVIQKIGNDIEP